MRLLGVVSVLLLSGGTAQAATLVIETNCSLVDAIVSVNTDTATGGCPAGDGPDAIHLTGDVVLTVEDLDGPDPGLPWITSEVSIEGFGWTIVRADGAPTNSPILRLSDQAHLTVHDLALEVRQDSGLSGGLVGASGTTLLCFNKSVRQRVQVNLGGGDSWDCTASGLNTSPGDRVVERVVANAENVDVGGWTEGLRGRRVTCQNRTAGGRRIVRPQDGVDQWSCTQAGLQVSPGDVILQVVTGTVE